MLHGVARFAQTCFEEFLTVLLVPRVIHKVWVETRFDFHISLDALKVPISRVSTVILKV